ncbi:hypothetical protein H4S06_002462, partial [Coemansia sp. BCRC 34490]
MDAQPTEASPNAQNVDSNGSQGDSVSLKHQKQRKHNGKTAEHPHDAVKSEGTVQSGKNKGKDSGSKPGTASEEENICFICADTVRFFAIGECNHLTCFRCNLRLRALFKSKACPYCKVEMDTVIHTSNSGMTFDELSKRPLPCTDKNLNIKFDSKEAYNVAMHTL